MKVILLSDVAKVGKKYDLAEVKPGFARNFLFAKGLAEAVTKSSAKRVAEMQKKREMERKEQNELLDRSFEGIKSAVLIMKRAANEDAHLYAGIGAEELALLLGKTIGVAIAPEYIKMEKPIKQVGEFSIPVELNGKKGDFKVVIEAE